MDTMLQYKCPCCGGAIEFDSTLQKMKCPFCDTEFDVETLKAYDEAVKQDGTDAMEWDTSGGETWSEEDNMAVYVCESCGGEVVCDSTTAATACPYCENPVVMKGKLSGDLRPDWVIPFKLDKEAAKKGMLAHLSGKPLLPKAFKSENHIDEIKGIYVPFWLFDADADGAFRYKATKVRTWSDSRYRYTETSHFSIQRAGHIAFDRVPVDGSSKMADDLMESVEPYDFSEAVDFQTAYLAGYLADRYDVDVEQSVERANQRIKSSTETEFRNTVHGYTTVTQESANISLSDNRSHYALYPVWILNTTWRDQKYTFAMNGQTGKFVGNLPMDKGAFARWFAGVGSVAAAIAFAVLYFFF